MAPVHAPHPAQLLLPVGPLELRRSRPWRRREVPEGCDRRLYVGPETFVRHPGMLPDRQNGNVERFGHRGSPSALPARFPFLSGSASVNACEKRALSVRLAEVRKYLVMV
ncbi:hypothetical protein STRIP9103_02536 [Streptomyces ipomoeae 91-03]|uniref:Uncharacterized protein n=1 Tax=Streptomyces ipomoeae 91-03 TaxID=698759 RepID=L1KIF4_9ACTN|nr:hypothetical protein STRIP9103_02536 [Streptomyces ipomoeae 91-03]